VVEDTSSVFADNLGASHAAGGVAIEADTIEIRGGGAIRSSTRGAGNAGEVRVAAAGHREIDTAGVSAGIAPGITSRADDGFTGAAGRVAVTADTLEIRGGGPSGLSSSTFDPGAAGEFAATAGCLAVADGGSVETNSEQASGAAGDVSVQARYLTVRNVGLIGSSGIGAAPAGDVRVEADTLEVEDASIRTEGRSNTGGAIAVAASDLIHRQEAEVTSYGAELSQVPA
jgi:hypothetical protein